MLNPGQFRQLIVAPALQTIGLWSQAAENLVWGTAVHESRLVYLKQLNGPADGLFQIEPATHNDLWQNWLNYQPSLALRIHTLLAPEPGLEEQLTTNLLYAAAICRALYARHPEPLPDASNVPALAAYWKLVYNTPLGAGKPEDWAAHYTAAIHG